MNGERGVEGPSKEEMGLGEGKEGVRESEHSESDWVKDDSLATELRRIEAQCSEIVSQNPALKNERAYTRAAGYEAPEDGQFGLMSFLDEETKQRFGKPEYEEMMNNKISDAKQRLKKLQEEQQNW